MAAPRKYFRSCWSKRDQSLIESITGLNLSYFVGNKEFDVFLRESEENLIYFKKIVLMLYTVGLIYREIRYLIE